MQIAWVILGLLTAGLAAFCGWLLLQQKALTLSIERQAKQLAALEQRLKDASKNFDAYLAVNVRMGDELDRLGKQLAPLPERLLRLEQRDPSSLTFSQAARLVGMGASAADLTQSCGLSQAEAELVARLHQPKTTEP